MVIHLIKFIDYNDYKIRAVTLRSAGHSDTSVSDWCTAFIAIHVTVISVLYTLIINLRLLKA